MSLTTVSHDVGICSKNMHIAGELMTMHIKTKLFQTFRNYVNIGCPKHFHENIY